MGKIYEWYGYRISDNSEAARQSAEQKHCPFLDRDCTKKGGVCSVLPGAKEEPVIVCPKRLYFSGHTFLQNIAATSFASIAEYQPYNADANGMPSLVPGRTAKAQAKSTGKAQVGVFGHGWGGTSAATKSGEVRLPGVIEGQNYSVDFTVVLVSPTGELLAYSAVEVQTIDTTGNYKTSLEAVQLNRSDVASPALGMNWENVAKRIIPQLIFKGLLLQGEPKCTSGIYFVAPEPVYERVLARLSGPRLRELFPQHGSITFIPYSYAPTPHLDGQPIPLNRQPGRTISTSDMAQAFITPQNLPAPGSYATAIEKRL